MDNDIYKMILSDVKKTLDETTTHTPKTDYKKLNNKQKDERIKQLEDENRQLKTELIIRKSVDERYISGLLESKHKQISALLNNPILTLPSGQQIQFSSLNAEQLLFLEEISQKQNSRKI